MRQRTWSKHEYDLFHWRDRNGLEVDVIVELASGYLLGVEVKATSTLKGDHFKGLKALRDRLGDRFVGGVVLSMDPRGIPFGDRLTGLPVASLWES